MKKRITYSTLAAVLIAAVFLTAGLLTASHRAPEPTAAPVETSAHPTVVPPTPEPTPEPTLPPEITPPASHPADAASASDVHLHPGLPASNSDLSSAAAQATESAPPAEAKK
ncbi:MAG: hypothetical protein E7472_03635 [Ruminococcaceae bacterium]|nr:hypothetical protein [Oscillospiraceae bacterium]